MDKESPSEQTTGGLSFPCLFGIKIFGLATTEFQQATLAILKKYVPDLTDDNIIRRPSKDGKYLALTITIHAQSRDQLDGIYQDLTKNPLIIMAL